jgi:pimeloyl-ACP methyl ester carboxylesterase
VRFQSIDVSLPPWKVREFREGSGEPLVLLHGLSGSFGWWRRNREELAGESTVLGLDLVGFGSRRSLLEPQLPLGFHDAAQLLARWIEERIGEPVHLVGHSMGGQISIHLAASRPDLVRSLVLVCSSGLPPALRPIPHVRQMLRPPGTVLSFLPVLLRDFIRAGPASVGMALSHVLLDDAREAMETIRTPTLLLWGENDPVLPLRYGGEMNRLIEGSELRVIPRAGHIPMWDQPREFNRHVLEFLRRSSPEVSTGTEPGRDRPFSWTVMGCAAGICHRSSPGRDDVVLIHGLAIRSGYFENLARVLYAGGWGAVAPDLPGFGHSSALGVIPLPELVAAVARWADELELRDRVWVGHSTGAQLVEALMGSRPDLVRSALFVGPIWSDAPLSLLHLAQGILRDATREPPGLFLIALRSWWDAGLVRFVRSFLHHARHADEVRELPLRTGIVIGKDDPVVDREYLASIDEDLREIPGAHGIVHTHPRELAGLIEALMGSGARRATSDE